jgi:hypothetical protein
VSAARNIFVDIVENLCESHEVGPGFLIVGLVRLRAQNWSDYRNAFETRLTSYYDPPFALIVVVYRPASTHLRTQSKASMTAGPRRLRDSGMKSLVSLKTRSVSALIAGIVKEPA